MISLFVSDPSWEPFQVKTHKPFTMTGQPYPKVCRNIWNIPLLFDSYLMTPGNLPDHDPKGVVVICERSRFDLTILRKKYPNAKLICHAKEWFPGRSPQEIAWVCNEVDTVQMPFVVSSLAPLQAKINKPIGQVFYPYEVDYFHGKYAVPWENKRDAIMVCAHTAKGRGQVQSLELAKMMASKMGMHYEVRAFNSSWDDWLLDMASYKYCINVDMQHRIGQVPIEAAILGTVHIGGLSDGAERMWPDTFGSDLNKLAANSSYYLESGEDLAKKAFEIVMRDHSYSRVRETYQRIVT